VIHIHNGDVVAAFAQRAGIPGEHFAFRESLIAGPVVPGEDWIETRTQALAQPAPEDQLRTRTALVEQEQALDAAREKGEIVLWFEHDLFCLIHLVYLLQRFGDAHMTLVWCPRPLTDNDERGLHLLFESRRAITPSMLSIARDVWRAYTAADPTGLNQWIARDTPDFPFLREGLALHASRFPSTTNGLGAIEQRALSLIATGATEFTSLFNVMASDEPRFGFGDSEIFRTLQSMAWCAVPLVTLSGEPPKAMATITPAGENVLRGAVDDTAVNDPDRWLGGVHLTKENLWRWDGTALRAGLRMKD
jgi:hypothetical protein